MARNATYWVWENSAWMDYFFATSAAQVGEITSGGAGVERNFVTTGQKTALEALRPLVTSSGKLAWGGIHHLLDGGSNQTLSTIKLGNHKADNTIQSWIQFQDSGLNVEILSRGSGSDSIVTLSPHLSNGTKKSAVFTAAANGVVVTGIQSGSTDTSLVNKLYVDAKVTYGSLPKEPVKAATTANITLTGGQTIDGYTTQTNDRILVWKQDTASQNGVYLAQSGAWTRVTATAAAERGFMLFVENGTLYNDRIMWCSDDAGTWIEHSKVDTITAGTGLSKSGNALSIADQGVTYAKIQNVAQNTILGRIDSGSGPVTALSAFNARAATGAARIYFGTDRTSIGSGNLNAGDVYLQYAA